MRILPYRSSTPSLACKDAEGNTEGVWLESAQRNWHKFLMIFGLGHGTRSLHNSSNRHSQEPACCYGRGRYNRLLDCTVRNITCSVGSVSSLMESIMGLIMGLSFAGSVCSEMMAPAMQLCTLFY